MPNRVIQSSAPLGPISLRSAPQTAAEALRNAIIGGQLRPGDRLIEQKLARSLGIGQPTLREALLELEYQGFVRKVPQRGTYVTKLTKDDFRKIMEVRMALELLAIDGAARNMTRDDADILKALVEDMATAAKTFDLGAFHKSDIAFHRKVWALAGNEYLEKALEGTAFRLFAFVLLQRTSTSSRSEFLHATEQHKAILAGLCSYDPVKARQAFVSNTLKFWAEHHQVNVGEWVFAGMSSEGLATSE